MTDTEMRQLKDRAINTTTSVEVAAALIIADSNMEIAKAQNRIADAIGQLMEEAITIRLR